MLAGRAPKGFTGKHLFGDYGMSDWPVPTLDLVSVLEINCTYTC